jgi:superfamily II DNA or RNA helicase
MFELRDYQQELMNKINSSINLRNCIQLSTGGGKTIIFSQLANEFNGNVLILVNRIELLEQTAKNINRPLGIISAGTQDENQVTIGMVESVYNRIKKGTFNLDNIDLIIVDEIQNLQFTKVFDNYNKRLLGFTATPVIDKKEFYFKCRYCEEKSEKSIVCCGKETKEYSKTITLKKWYGDLITGIPIKNLIEREFLTQVKEFICDNSNLDKLKTDKSGQFTSKSEDEVFNNYASLENLVLNYEEHCKGQKTMVFNSNLKANNLAFEQFKELGYNVRSYDSKSKENRKEIVDWFKNTPDGVLMSVGVFTTGFDVEDVQCIILNKATKSLSLYHQIVGRGGRITNKIYKPFFKLVDLGGNVKRFGSWSDKVDWNKIYNNQIEKKRIVRDLEDFKICFNCEAMINSYPCQYCGSIEPEKKEKKSIVSIAKELKKLPPPKATHILKYALANNLDINDAKVLTANYIVDMFIFSQTTIPTIQKNKDYLKAEIKRFVRPIYFALNNSKLKGNRKRTIADFENKIFKKINKHYENRS